jgi:tetratricopeptide (TPR) repeat protein
MKDGSVARKKNPNPTAETLKGLEESGDRVAEWAAENAALILGAIAAVLVIAGAAGLYVQHDDNSRDAAADSLALATSQYRQAMGADPVGGPIPEPANPELGEKTRSEYVERFVQVARDHENTTAGALAWLEAGQLQTELGRLEAAAESFGRARDAAEGSAIEALGSVRLASLAEGRGDAASAASAYEAAADVTAYPLRAGALADAARCWVDAGEEDKALAAFQRLEVEFPDGTIPPHISSLMAAIRLAK